MATKPQTTGMASSLKSAVEVDTVQDRFRACALEVCKRVMNAVRRAEKIPEDKRFPIPSLDDLQKVLETLEKGPENPLSSKLIIEMFITGSYSIWNSIFVKDQNTLMGIVGKLLPSIKPEVVAKYQNLVRIQLEDKKLLINEDEVNWFWKYFQQMVRQCIAYMLEICQKEDSIVINGTMTFTKKELDELKVKWDTTRPTAGKP